MMTAVEALQAGCTVMRPRGPGFDEQKGMFPHRLVEIVPEEPGESVRQLLGSVIEGQSPEPYRPPAGGQYEAFLPSQPRRALSSDS